MHQLGRQYFMTKRKRAFPPRLCCSVTEMKQQRKMKTCLKKQLAASLESQEKEDRRALLAAIRSGAQMLSFKRGDKSDLRPECRLQPPRRLPHLLVHQSPGDEVASSASSQTHRQTHLLADTVTTCLSGESQLPACNPVNGSHRALMVPIRIC